MPLTKQDLLEIKGVVSEVVTAEIGGSRTANVIRGIVREEVSGLATKLDLADVRKDLSLKIDQVKTMLQEDLVAESKRITAIDRRQRKLRREFNAAR